MTKPVPSALIDITILALFAARHCDATLCPYDIARHIAGKDWRELMPLIHRQVKAQARRGNLRLKQKGVSVQPDHLQGVYRIARPEKRGLAQKRVSDV